MVFCRLLGDVNVFRVNVFRRDRIGVSRFWLGGVILLVFMRVVYVGS